MKYPKLLNSLRQNVDWTGDGESGWAVTVYWGCWLPLGVWKFGELVSDMVHCGCTNCFRVNDQGHNMWILTLLSPVQLLSHVQLFVTPRTAARQASLSITNSWNLLKLMSIASVIPSNHLILCLPLLLLPSIFPSIRVFSNESVLHIRWPKYWSFDLNISPSNEHRGLIDLL